MFSLLFFALIASMALLAMSNNITYSKPHYVDYDRSEFHSDKFHSVGNACPDDYPTQDGHCCPPGYPVLCTADQKAHKGCYGCDEGYFCCTEDGDAMCCHNGDQW